MSESDIELVEGSDKVFRDLGDPQAEFRYGVAILPVGKRRADSPVRQHRGPSLRGDRGRPPLRWPATGSRKTPLQAPLLPC
ncbi:MAG: hypothetical protein J4F97_00785 [Pseudomonadales bacterium]|nr:hypothetical protein [Pseudomonadales bacterium]